MSSKTQTGAAVWLLVLSTALAGWRPVDAAKRSVRISNEAKAWKIPGWPIPKPYRKTQDPLFHKVRGEALPLFQKVWALNASVEVTGHIWQFPAQAEFYTKVISTAKLPDDGGLLCEVGFGSGLSSLGYLMSNPKIKLLTFDLWADVGGRFGFDPVMEKRKDVAEVVLKAKFGDRWNVVKGDSVKTIPNYFEQHPDTMCDIIHIDGNHTMGGTLIDLAYFQTRAKKSHTVLIDDLQFRDVQKSLFAINDGIASHDCYSTTERDPVFMGRKANRRSLKFWCQFSYNTDWIPDNAWKTAFRGYSGYDLDPRIASGNPLASKFGQPLDQKIAADIPLSSGSSRPTSPVSEPRQKPQLVITAALVTPPPLSGDAAFDPSGLAVVTLTTITIVIFLKFKRR